MTKKSALYDRLLRSAPSSTSTPFHSKFGASILKKFGWEEGAGLGKDEEGMKSCIIVKRHQVGLGLGAVSKEKSDVYQWSNWWEDMYNDVASKIQDALACPLSTLAAAETTVEARVVTTTTTSVVNLHTVEEKKMKKRRKSSNLDESLDVSKKKKRKSEEYALEDSPAISEGESQTHPKLSGVKKPKMKTTDSTVSANSPALDEDVGMVEKKQKKKKKKRDEKNKEGGK